QYSRDHIGAVAARCPTVSAEPSAGTLPRAVRNDRREVPAFISLLPFSGGRVRGTHADDLKDAFFILRAVVMNLSTVMHDVASGRNWFHSVGIVVRARVYPPRSFENRDVTIVGMRMRAAVVMR